MYIESKAESLNGPARIGRVTFSKTGLTLDYKGREFQKFQGYKANHFDLETRDEYWISGPRRDGEDRLYVSNLAVEIDEDVREEYWTEIHKKPDLKHKFRT
jgi:hypothetical protein